MFKFAVKEMANVSVQILEKNGLTGKMCVLFAAPGKPAHHRCQCQPDGLDPARWSSISTGTPIPRRAHPAVSL